MNEYSFSPLRKLIDDEKQQSMRQGEDNAEETTAWFSELSLSISTSITKGNTV